jgi:hypothetical protein
MIGKHNHFSHPFFSYYSKYKYEYVQVATKKMGFDLGLW